MIRRSTGILLLVFTLLLLVTVYIQSRESSNEANVTPTIEADPPLLDISEGEDILGLRIMSDSDSVIDLNRQNASGNWNMTGKGNGIVDNDRINSSLSRLETVTSKAELDADTPMDVLGLASPAYTITLKISEGNKFHIHVGNVTIASDSYYSRIGDGQAVVVTKSGLDAVIGLLEDPPILLPTSTPISTATQTPQP